MSIEWLSIDPSVFHFVSSKSTRNDYDVNETSSLLSLLEAQIRFELESLSFNAKSTTSTIKFEDQSHSNIEPTHFVSALDKFNEIVSDCDVIQRFQDKLYECLANNKSDARCEWTMSFRTSENIKQILTQLTEMNIYLNMQKWLDQLVAFIKIAVCHHQRDPIIRKLKSQLREDRSNRFAQITSITAVVKTERDRSADQFESALMKSNSELNSTREERRVTTSIISSAIKITYWLREPLRQTLHFLSEYRSYQYPESRSRSIREWIVEQAKKSLFIRHSRNISTFQELNERKNEYLYVYWNRVSFELIKIECTTIDVDRRLQEWENKCQRLIEKHYRSPFKIKHVIRVEKLIHIEFREYRVSESFCHDCRDKHIEWFRGLNLGFVIKTIKAWTEWMMKEPYEKRLGCWRLKQTLESDMSQICVTPDEKDNSKRIKGSIAKESSRYNLRRRQASGSFRSSSPRTPSWAF